MNRKVLQAGQFTLSVSLPMPWVKKFKIKKGDDLCVTDKGNSLDISVKKIIKDESAIVHVSDTLPNTTKILGMLYKLGYKKIVAIYNPTAVVMHRGQKISELDMVRNTFQHLTGMQITEVGKKGNIHYVICVEKASVESKEFGNTFNQLYLHVIHQAERTLEYPLIDSNLLNESYFVETLINQGQDFCVRVLTTHGHSDFTKTPLYYDFATTLESIADDYFKLHEWMTKHKKRLDEESIKFYETNLQLLRMSASLHRKFNTKSMNSFSNEVVSAKINFENQTKLGIPCVYAWSILNKITEIIEIIYAINHSQFSDNDKRL